MVEKDIQYGEYKYEPGPDCGMGELDECQYKTFNEETQEIEFESMQAYMFKFVNRDAIPHPVYVFADGAYQFGPATDF